MSEIASTVKHINSIDDSDLLDSSSLPSTSPRCSSSSFSSWRINYKVMPRKSASKGIWDGYETQDEFLTMHLR